MIKKFSNRFSRGFTLIELLVVIAIIGILSSVVLASLNTARSKGSNAAIKSNLNNIRAQAEIVYDSAPGSYAGVCADPTISRGVIAAATAGSATVAATNAASSATEAACQNSSTAWAISAPLKAAEAGNNYWCIDSTGQSRGEANPTAASTFVCA